MQWVACEQAVSGEKTACSQAMQSEHSLANKASCSNLREIELEKTFF